VSSKRGLITKQRIAPAKLERAKELRRHMTPAERRLWQRVRANRLDGFHFRRQQIIDGFIVDFYCHAAGLVVEIDGSIHDEQIKYDAERERVLRSRGLRILRFRNEEVEQELESVVERIRAACRVAEDDLTPRPLPCQGRGSPPMGQSSRKQVSLPRLERGQGRDRRGAGRASRPPAENNTRGTLW